MDITLKDNQFQLSKVKVSGDIITKFGFASGTFAFFGDTLILQSDDKRTFKLLRENPEIFDPLSVDSVLEGQKFMAWTSYYNNGQPKQNGGWTPEGGKEGVWQYFDSSSSRVIDKRLYKNGQLITDHFKWSWEK